MEFFDAALKVFKLDEGEGEKPGMPYKDIYDNWTIGIGHLIGKNLESLRLSNAIVDALFREDLAKSIALARLILGSDFFNGLCLPRQIAFVSLAFTMGRGLLSFDETIRLARSGDWEGVAAHVMSSKWARDVDPKQRKGRGRDDRIAYMFEKGEFHPDYGVAS